jgi:hypothetical protein
MREAEGAVSVCSWRCANGRSGLDLAWMELRVSDVRHFEVLVEGHTRKYLIQATPKQKRRM